MTQNAIPARDPLAVRIAGRALAARESGYASEVRRFLDAGLEVMRRSGTTTSPRVADIVAAAGLSNEAFYRHFAGKDALVAAILEDGNTRLRSYLTHQMDKESTPLAKLTRWIEGVMSQAADPDVAASTLAVMWNGARVGERVRGGDVSHHAALSALLHDVVADLGSPDPREDSSLVAHTTLGRLEEYLWRGEHPSAAQIGQVVSFVTGAVTRETGPTGT